MTHPAPRRALAPVLRRQQLLLASQQARHRALRDFEDLAQPADAFAHRMLALRDWLSGPAGWATAGGVVLVAAVALRRVRLVRLLRWAWLAGRLWRLAAAAAGQARGQGLSTLRG